MNKIVFKKGESVTIGFLLNSEYDMSRIQSASAWVGGKKFALATIDHMLRCELASDETHKLSGNYKLILWIDDSTLGVKKTYVADIEISTNNSNDNNDSTNEGYDFVFNITINETAIQAGDVLHNYVKGNNADLPEGIVIDTNYVHTDNNYDDEAVTEVAKVAGKANSADVYTKSETYTKTEINNKLSAVYKFKGSVLTYDLLPTDAENADVWNVVNGITPELNGMNYAWNSTLSAWDAIGGIVGLATLTENGLMSKDDFKKLSDIYTKEDLDLILANKSDVGHNHSGETINPEAIDFDLTPTTDPNIQGRMQYSPTERTIEFGVEGGTIDVNKELFDYYVDTDNNLVEGNVVSVTGISGNRQAVTKTNHTLRASATACIGMVTHKNADNTVRVTKKGRVRKLNTGGMTEGLPVYANATGGFTQTEPNAGDYFIHVGIVEVAHAVNGVVDVDIRIVYDVEDLSNVDGAATTVGSGDSFFIKVGNLWKTITESNFLTWLRGLSHTFTQLITFSGNLKTTKIIPNSDTTGVVIRNAEDSADVVKVDTSSTTNRAVFSVSGYNGSKIFEAYDDGGTANPNTDYIVTYPQNNSHKAFIGTKNGGEVWFTGSKIIIFNGGTNGGTLRFGTSGVGEIIVTNNILRILTGTGKIGIEINTPETKLDINGTTTHRDWTYFNNGTHTGDAVGDIRMKNISGVLTFYRCTVGNTTKGSGTWEQIHTIG